MIVRHPTSLIFPFYLTRSLSECNVSVNASSYSSALPLPALILFMCDASDSFNKTPDDLHEDRQSKRVPTKVPGSLVVAPDYENLRRIPCLIIDVSPRGFRLRASGRLRRGGLGHAARGTGRVCITTTEEQSRIV